MEWWNSARSIEDPLHCFANVTVINTHAHFGATVTSLFVADIHMTVNCGHGVSSSPTLLEIDDSFTSVADRILLKGF